MIALFLGIIYFIGTSMILVVFNLLLLLFTLVCIFFVIYKIMVLLLRFPKIIVLLGMSPIFNFSCPSNFGEINYNDVIEHSKEMYFSLFSFKVGSIYFLFITKRIGETGYFFEMVRKVSLNDIQKLPRYERINEKYDEYITYLFGNSYDKRKTGKFNKDIEKEINSYSEILEIYLDKTNRTSELTTNKINLYTAIVAVIMPLQANFFKLNNNSIGMFLFMLLLLLLYQYVNLFLFFFRYIKVKEYTELIPGNFITKKNAKAEVLLMKYYNGMLQEDKNLYNVTILKNIEKYFRYSLIISLIIYMSVLIK